MRNFFLHEIPAPGSLVELDDDEAHHASVVLRLKSQGTICLLDGRGTRAVAGVAPGGRRGRLVCIVESRDTVPPPPGGIVLHIAPPRHKQMGMIVRQAVELGVRRLVPVVCEHSVALPAQAAKQEKWLDDAVAACKQSGNLFLPEICPPVPFPEAVATAPRPGIYGEPRAGGWTALQPLAAAAPGPVSVWIGPEGGFSEAEKQRLQDAGFAPFGLGCWTLRVETAVVAVLGALVAAMETGHS